MTSKILLSFSLILIISVAFAQKGPGPANPDRIIDSLYRNKKFQEAARGYIGLAENADFVQKRSKSYYQAAGCYSILDKKDSAFYYLNKSIAGGFNARKRLMEDDDFKTIRSDARWDKLVSGVKEVKKNTNHDPRKAKIITSDIDNFWTAYDKAVQNTLNFKSIFKKYYFDKGTEGMQDYMGSKVRSIDAFLFHVRSLPAFYSTIRSNSYIPLRMKDNLMAAFQKLQSMYPEAEFPDVYFVIGAFTSAGTVSDHGLLIGINQFCDDQNVSKTEMNLRTRSMLASKELIPGLVPHELIHFQQNGLKRDTTTLSYAILEGMADFIGEKISGINSNAGLYHWAEGKEKAIWTRFTADMYRNKYNNWLANGQTSTPDNPKDQGYWVGYQICKAYYDQASDKNKAIREMLSIQDYPKFLRDSGWEKIVAGL